MQYSGRCYAIVDKMADVPEIEIMRRDAVVIISYYMATWLTTQSFLPLNALAASYTRRRPLQTHSIDYKTRRYVQH